MKFAGDAEPADAPAASFWSRFDKSDLYRLVENGLIALGVLAAILFVLRPMALRLSVAPAASSLLPGGDASALPSVAGAVGDGTVRLEGGTDAMTKVANVDGELRVASITRVANLVEERAEDSLAMLRNWLAEAN